MMSFVEYVNNYFGWEVDINDVSEDELDFIYELYEMEVVECR